MASSVTQDIWIHHILPQCDDRDMRTLRLLNSQFDSAVKNFDPAWIGPYRKRAYVETPDITILRPGAKAIEDIPSSRLYEETMRLIKRKTASQLGSQSISLARAQWKLGRCQRELAALKEERKSLNRKSVINRNIRSKEATCLRLKANVENWSSKVDATQALVDRRRV